MSQASIASKRLGFFANFSPSLAVIAICAVVLSIGWGLFAHRLSSRSRRARVSSQDIRRIWGGPLVQPHPQVRWRRADAATVALTEGQLSKTDIDVTLDATYRRRGTVEYPGYQAAFSGQYTFDNPVGQNVFVAFSVGLPVERSALMLSDLALLIDGEEDPRHTEYSENRIVWTGSVEAGATRSFRLDYRGRGLERFGYALSARGKDAHQPVTGFALRMKINGARGQLDFPTGSMAPTTIQPNQESQVLIWQVDRLLTAFDVGVVLPDNMHIHRAIGHLIRNAPAFYLLFALGLLLSLLSAGRWARALHILGLSVAYFLYFPLLTYLVVYLPWPLASGLALTLIAGLMLIHIVRFVGWSAARRVMVSQGFFLATPAVAYLIPAHAGLILVIAGVLALGVGLHVLGVLAQHLNAPQLASQEAS